MLLIDTNHPMYRPLWVRLLIVGVCAGWAVLEFINNEPFWMTVVGGIALYSAYVLLLTFKPSDQKPEEPVVRPEQE
ncbi:hypothetical protein [Agrobacterium larrymoorei]|uniref:hypothetical protein n=1 Tax=Agrobacterium larrymoorei TaxID=160699 RepID=UPI0030C297CF